MVYSQARSIHQQWGWKEAGAAPGMLYPAVLPVYSFCFRELVAVLQPFSRQRILFGRVFRHGLNPFSSGAGPVPGPRGLAQNVAPAVAV